MFAAQTPNSNFGQENVGQASGDPAIDLVHLARQTFGDIALEAELLAMFDAQAAKIAARLRHNELGARRSLTSPTSSKARRLPSALTV